MMATARVHPAEPPADLDREAAHRKSGGGQHFEVVELLDVAIADLAPRLVALPDQARVLGLEVLLLGVHERRVPAPRSEEHTSELQSQSNLVCRLLLEKKKKNNKLTSNKNISNIRNITN